ncbi:MAG: hypothetical protein Q9166_005244 [cf. Caloplaca sp. 2 TL-2023]
MAIFSIRKHSLRTRDDKRTTASELTLRQSIYPLCLVTILFFLWGFSYGLLDTLNKHFQNTLGISKARSSGLQAAYFVCGPPRYSEIRINLAQAFNAVGTVIAPVLGSYVFFKDVGDNGAAIRNVQWVYLAIACFVFLLAVIFYFSTIPEITDADMMYQVQETHFGVAEKPFRKQYRSVSTQIRKSMYPENPYRLFHAAFAQFCYTGAQSAIYLAVAQGCFAVGRFSGSFFMHYVKARADIPVLGNSWVFLAYLTCVIIFNSAATTQKQDTGIAMLSLTLFFESVCFPTIVALGIRGIGKHTKRGSGLIVAGVSGGAAVPPILGATADVKGTATAMVVPVCFMIAAWTYALAVNFVPSYRNPADQIGAATSSIQDNAEETSAHDDSGEEAGPSGVPSQEETTRNRYLTSPENGPPASAVVDFAQSVESEGKREADAEASRRITICTTAPVPEEEQTQDEIYNHRSSGIHVRLSQVARNITRSHDRHPSVSNGRETVRQSISSIPEDEDPAVDSSDFSSRVLRRLSYIGRSIGGRRASIISNAQSLRQHVFRPREASIDVEGHPGANSVRNRDSKAIPKSWRFLGIDDTGIGNAVGNVAHKMRKSNIREMYEKAKVKQQQIKRSNTGQLIFRYTFYTLVLASVYLILVGLPLWRGAVWYLYILFQKYMVLKAGLTITFGIGFLYAYTPLLINFEPTAPPPDAVEAGESGSAKSSCSDTALIIPCYKSEGLIGNTLEGALKIFPKESIFVIANGNSPEPLDNTAAVCKQYGVSHTWSPLGSKIIAQFVGCYVARDFPNVLLIDDDCLLPPNFPIVSDRLRGNVKCIGYIMRATGPHGSKGTLCQQAQDIEYKLSGLAKSFAGKVGSVTFPHGCIVLWDRELLVQTFQEHPGFSVSEDWFFGHAARRLGSRIKMCTSTFVETEVPSSVFFSGGGARGGFGEFVHTSPVTSGCCSLTDGL